MSEAPNKNIAHYIPFHFRTREIFIERSSATRITVQPSMLNYGQEYYGGVHKVIVDIEMNVWTPTIINRWDYISRFPLNEDIWFTVSPDNDQELLLLKIAHPDVLFLSDDLPLQIISALTEHINRYRNENKLW